MWNASERYKDCICCVFSTDCLLHRQGLAVPWLLRWCSMQYNTSYPVGTLELSYCWGWDIRFMILNRKFSSRHQSTKHRVFQSGDLSLSPTALWHIQIPRLHPTGNITVQWHVTMTFTQDNMLNNFTGKKVQKHIHTNIYVGLVCLFICTACMF